MSQTPFQQYSRFYAADNMQQQPYEPVDISNWSFGGDFSPYADGTRAKFEVWCPNIDEVEYSFLIPQHRYMYKRTFERRGKDGKVILFGEQFWVEIVAYHVGRVLGVEVPPAFVGCRTLPDGQLEYARLIEWYYGYSGMKAHLVDRGGDYMSRVIHGYDRDKGAQHNFQSIRQVCEAEKVEGWLESWARMLCFDAIIGNTDRHQENWEVLHFVDDMSVRRVMSPAFDNGTAMGYQILNNKIAGKMQNLSAFIDKGYHHMKWRIEDEKHALHFELLEELLAAFPQCRKPLQAMLERDISRIDGIIEQLTKFDIRDARYRLSEERAEFMLALIHARYQKAKELVDI